MLGTHITYSFTPGHFMIQKTLFQKQKKKKGKGLIQMFGNTEAGTW